MRPVNPNNAGEEVWTQTLRRLEQVERAGKAALLASTVAPTANDGSDGDFWLDRAACRLYGPKGLDIAGEWPPTYLSVGSNRPWTPLALQNAWVNFGGAYAPAEYRVDGDWVHLRGVIARSTAAAYPAPIATLPAGARPIREEVFLCSSGSVAFNTAAFTRVHVSTTGVITLVDGNTTNSATNTSLSGIGFSTS